jgi:hypothetical protein
VRGIDRDQVLLIFLASKMLATARALHDNQLVGEGASEWRLFSSFAAMRVKNASPADGEVWGKLDPKARKRIQNPIEVADFR